MSMEDVVVPMATIALASSDDISNSLLLCSVSYISQGPFFIGNRSLLTR